MGKLHANIEKKLQNSFWKNGEKLDLTFKGHQGQRSWGELKDHVWLTICVSYKLFITCTVSDILTQIDRKGQNRTFRPWQMTFRANPLPPYFGTVLLSPQRRFFMQTNWQHFGFTERCLIIWLKMRKGQNPSFPTLTNDFRSYSMKTMCTRCQHSHREVPCQNRRKFISPFWRISSLKFRQWYYLIINCGGICKCILWWKWWREDHCEHQSISGSFFLTTWSLLSWARMFPYGIEMDLQHLYQCCVFFLWQRNIQPRQKL